MPAAHLASASPPLPLPLPGRGGAGAGGLPGSHSAVPGTRSPPQFSQGRKRRWAREGAGRERRGTAGRSSAAGSEGGGARAGTKAGARAQSPPPPPGPAGNKGHTRPGWPDNAPAAACGRRRGCDLVCVCVCGGEERGAREARLGLVWAWGPASPRDAPAQALSPSGNRARPQKHRRPAPVQLREGTVGRGWRRLPCF